MVNMIKIVTTNDLYDPFYLNEDYIYEMQEQGNGDWIIYSVVNNYRISKENKERLIKGEEMEK